ncbi:hypothetical protein PIB30_005717 [Stylosanthes scabra]|uniref:Uncharacterized protein n=1 Tax=Stylosanthes scabra TaxID=79078 RepID=A0ABU6V5H9_9FABA|nr:hypothetical protein [Stylosanthes scabra]
MIAEAPHTHSSKCVMLGRGIHTFIRHASFSSPTDVGLHNPPPIKEPSVATGTSIWASPLIPFPKPPHSLVKMRHARERYSHPYKACFVLLPTDVGLQNAPPKGAQHPRWHIDLGSGSDTICNSPNHPLARYYSFWHIRPHDFAFDYKDDSRSPPQSLVKMRHASFSSQTDVRIHNPPPKGARRESS